MVKSYDKVCKYCGDSFTTNRANKDYCTPTHAKYDHEVRKGKRERPARILNGLEYTPLTEQESKEIKVKVDLLRKELLKIESEIETLKEQDEYSMDDPNPKVKEFILKKIRTTEKMNSLIRITIDPNNMIGDQVQEYAKSKMKYTFSDYKDYDRFFEVIGDQFQPFRAMILGKKKIGKTILSIKIANHLIKMIDASVLYVCSVDQEASVLQYAQNFESLNQNFALRVFTSELQIRQELKKKEFEFLIIDTLSDFVIPRQFFKDLLITYPRLSILTTSEKMPFTLVGLIDLRFELHRISHYTPTPYGEVETSYGALAKVYSNGVKSELDLLVYSAEINQEQNKFCIKDWGHEL